MCGWRYCRRQRHICFLRISSAIWARVAPEWRACESAHVLAEWRIWTQNGASRPVNAWVDPLQNWPAKQDVDPRVENLVPSGKTYPKDQESDLHGASRQGSLGNEDLMTVGYETNKQTNKKGQMINKKVFKKQKLGKKWKRQMKLVNVDAQ